MRRRATSDLSFQKTRSDGKLKIFNYSSNGKIGVKRAFDKERKKKEKRVMSRTKHGV